MLALIIFGMLFSAVATPTSAQEIDLSVTTDFNFAWNDTGSGGDRDGSFWNPDTLGVANVVSFGSAARSSYPPPLQLLVGESLTGVGAPNGAFAFPVGFSQIWNDSGSGANFDGSFWAPIPPPNYVSLGTVAQSGGAVPPLTSVVCVRSDLVVQGTIGALIYNDQGSGANSDFSAWDIEAPAGAIDVGTFIGVGNYAQPPSSAAWCLRADAIVSSTPTLAELQMLIETYGPILRLHPNELYMPDDPTAVLDDPNTTLTWALVQNPDSFSSFNQTILGGSATSSTTILDDVQAALSLPQATLPEFRYYINFDVGLSGGVPTLPLASGNLDHAKAYVRVRPIDGVVTELQFWIWYPWNGPGKSQAECGILPSIVFNPTGDAGTHYADWENIRIRVTNETLANPGTYTLLSAQLSRHSFDVEIAAANLIYSGTHPVVYVAKDSHAHYPSPGTFDYARVSSTDIGLCTASVDTFDQTSNGGPIFDTSSRYELVSSEWPTIATDPPDWFFFAGQWGGFDPNQFCVNAFGVGDIYCFEEIGNGKPGLMRRDGFDAAAPLNANLGSLRLSEESRGAACSNPGAVIDDFTSVQDSQTLSGGPTSINDVEVSIDIFHTWVDNLEVSVTSPQGTSVLLHNNAGDSAHLFVTYTTAGNDNVAPFNAGSSMVAAGLVGTESWIGEDANGSWILDVFDGATGDTGVVNRWCVTATDLSSIFDPEVADYTLDLPPGVASTFITPQAMNHEATVSILLDGVTYPVRADANPIAGQSSLLGLRSQSLPLLPGANSATISVSLANGLSRDYALTVNVAVPPAPSNDDCIAATAISTGATFGTTLNATNDGTGSCGVASTSPDVWYLYTAAVPGTLDVTTCGTHDLNGIDTGIDTVLSAFDACGGIELACNDNALDICAGLDAGLLRDSAVSIAVDAGQDVLIRVGTAAGLNPGEFQLNLAFTPSPLVGEFRRGDTSDDGNVALLDAIIILSYLFIGGDTPTCLDTADMNDDGSLALIDGVILLNYLFAGGSPPASPGPVICGPDVNVDNLATCVSNACP